MKAGISTGCFYPMEPEKAILEISRTQAQNIEIFFNCEYEISKKYLKNLKILIDNCGLKVVSIHPYTSGYEPYLLFSNYKRRTEETIKKYCRYFDACNILGAKIVNLHGDRLNKKLLSTEEYCEVYYNLRCKGKKQNVILSQENVNLYKSSQPEFISEMRKILNDDVNFTFDVKQAIRADIDIYKMIDAMGEKICNVHISDNKDNKCVLPGKGSLDYKKIFENINKYNYDGEVLLEVYSDCFKKIYDINCSINYLNSFF